MFPGLIVDLAAPVVGAAVSFRNFPENTAGVPGGDGVGRNISGDDASGSNDTVVSDGHSGKNGRTGADPDVAADRDRHGDFQSRLALFRINRMLGGGETAVRSNKHMVAERNLDAVGYNQIVIRIEVVADKDVVSVIAPERSWFVLTSVSSAFIMRSPILRPASCALEPTDIATM